MRKQSAVALLIIVCAAAGCVTDPPVREVQRDGVLAALTLVDIARQDASGATASVPIGGGGFVSIPLYGPGPKVAWYRHDVVLADGRLIAIIAQGEAHKVGDCVRVFERPEGFAQRRITYGFDCKR